VTYNELTNFYVQAGQTYIILIDLYRSLRSKKKLYLKTVFLYSV
jgi:hypothetical protein